MSTSDQKKKILVIDDEQNVVSYLEMLLQDNGYETVSARDGREGMDMVRREKPDLVTLDIAMPKTTGTRFYKEIKADPVRTSIPVVIITAVTGYAGDPYAYEKFIGKLRSIPPPDGFFPKPIDKDAFLQKIKELLS